VKPGTKRELNSSGDSSAAADFPSEPAGRETVKLRPFERSDFEALYEIDQKCYPPETAYSRREFRWYMRLPGAEAIIAEAQSVIAGFILTACFEQIGHIITIDVLTEFRRARVGTALLAAAEASLARRGAKEIELETAIDNDAAIQFWKRSGYQTRGILKNYYPGGLSAYAMMKRLDT
jgi:[ribosomal protein S18]-alanine N-acetyltransferase